MRWFVLTVGLIFALATSASALPPIPEYLPKILTGDEHKEYVKMLEASTMKCSSCHKPGADKKAKGHGLNDFGQAMHKHFDHKAFNAAHKAEKKEDAAKILKEAWDKTEADKNAAGETFGSLIKAGKLPSKNE